MQYLCKQWPGQALDIKLDAVKVLIVNRPYPGIKKYRLFYEVAYLISRRLWE
jgi:hypothetical protein